MYSAVQPSPSIPLSFSLCISVPLSSLPLQLVLRGSDEQSTRY